jgi:hypothetical protein
MPATNANKFEQTGMEWTDAAITTLIGRSGSFAAVCLTVCAMTPVKRRLARNMLEHVHRGQIARANKTVTQLAQQLINSFMPSLSSAGAEIEIFPSGLLVAPFRALYRLHHDRGTEIARIVSQS